MFYVCKKREDGKYGVFDTDDGVVEYYDPKTLIRVVHRFHLDVKGITFNNGKATISVQKPTYFESEGQPSSVGVASSTIQTGFASEFKGLIDEVSKEEFIEKLGVAGNHLVRVLNFVCGGVSGLTVDDIMELDGFDCIGFEDVPTRYNENYRLSVYTNPVVSVVPKESGVGYRLLKVEAENFGIDIMHGRDIVSHIDCRWKHLQEDIWGSEGWQLLTKE